MVSVVEEDVVLEAWYSMLLFQEFLVSQISEEVVLVVQFEVLEMAFASVVGLDVHT